MKKKLIKYDEIIIDSKSGYSGAGKKFDIKNISNKGSLNFYNYNTNNHRHISEIKQELLKHSDSDIKFSFNPHIMPIFRGMMSTIYCNLQDEINYHQITECLTDFYSDSFFVHFENDDKRIDFFKVQNTNNCFIKLFPHSSDNKIIIVSLIDNLIKGAAGQAIQCFNIIYNFDESLSLNN